VARGSDVDTCQGTQASLPHLASTSTSTSTCRLKKDHGRAEALLIAAWALGCSRTRGPTGSTAGSSTAAPQDAGSGEAGPTTKAKKGSASKKPSKGVAASDTTASTSTTSSSGLQVGEPSSSSSSSGGRSLLSTVKSEHEPGLLASDNESEELESMGEDEGEAEAGAGAQQKVVLAPGEHLTWEVHQGPLRRPMATDGYGNPMPDDNAVQVSSLMSSGWRRVEAHALLAQVATWLSGWLRADLCMCLA
jgi:hypothetical protein